jgi:hypothetical protein
VRIGPAGVAHLTEVNSSQDVTLLDHRALHYQDPFRDARSRSHASCPTSWRTSRVSNQAALPFETLPEQAAG